MNYLSLSFPKLLALALGTLALGSCNRAEYAMLPKSSSYHGTARVSTPVPAAAVVSPAPAANPKIASMPQPAAPVAASLPKAEPASAATVVPQPAAVKVATTSPAGTTVAIPAAPRKLNLVQRLTIAKLTKKLEKADRQALVAKHHDNTASTSRLDGKLRQGLILLLIGLLIGIVGGAVGGTIGGVIGLIGLIFVIVGAVILIIYLLDSV